ncbi:low molecular weight phosphatase family protein [Zhihengliuella sp.]|uniref:arsenate reductase/protein-tyrosine-phosphatase family protein n=1 Tax=Zhihengliuella sp. TaxID=1954483 RepID=UPI002811FC5C|nr:low molecular weight phosphatase family protein [Zhihengliuella sp.]
MIRILTVCTGNICRSPFAHLYLKHHLERVSPGNFEVASAGTYGLVGNAMDERAAAKLVASGVEPGDFVARRLDEKLLKDPDFVLTLAEEHREAVVAAAPRMLKRAFTVREFALVLRRIAEHDADRVPAGADQADARWKAVFRLASLHRSEVRSQSGGDLDVVDPYRREDSVYDQMTQQLLPALEEIVAFEEAAASR